MWLYCGLSDIAQGPALRDVLYRVPASSVAYFKSAARSCIPVACRTVPYAEIEQGLSLQSAYRTYRVESNVAGRDVGVRCSVLAGTEVHSFSSMGWPRHRETRTRLPSFWMLSRLIVLALWCASCCPGLCVSTFRCVVGDVGQRIWRQDLRHG